MQVTSYPSCIWHESQLQRHLTMQDSVVHAYLEECQASKVAQVVPPPLCEEEVVVHCCQTLPGDQVQVALCLITETQLPHHCCIECGVLLVESAGAILLHQHTLLSICNTGQAGCAAPTP